jgi:uncharacterized RDD family membrane protein YckC
MNIITIQTEGYNMDWGSFILLTIWCSIMLFFIQRSESKRRRLAVICVAFVGFLTWYWANFRGIGSAFWGGLIAAIIINYLFWLLIGRYNPVGSSDEIQVIGMDD